MIEKSRKYETLEALRGVAAIAVVVGHFSPLFTLRTFPYYFLAVDFFFMLSGFVISHAYQVKLDQGLATTRFMYSRFARLFPLNALAAIVALCGAHPSSVDHGSARLLLAAITALSFFPVWLTNVHGRLYPANGPTWTLSLDLLANLVHALVLRRLSLPKLCAAWGLAAIALGCGVKYAGGLNAGYQPELFLWVGIPRVLFSYTLGMLLYRAHRRSVLKLVVSPAVLCAGFGVFLLCPWATHEHVWELFALLILLPVVLLVASYNEPIGRASQVIFFWLGAVSYPVYVFHAVLAHLFEEAWPAASLHRPLSGVVFLAIVSGVANVLERYVDLPIRQRRTTRRRQVTASPAALHTLRG